MEVHDIVIVGAGIAGLTTSLGLHRLGIKSVVLESADSLRATGFAFTVWTNAWRALDAIGIGDFLRQQHNTIDGIQATSTASGALIAEQSFNAKGSRGDHEVRCVNRKSLLETLEKELPAGTVRYSCKVVSIQDSDPFKLIHLADGTILKAKVLVGCDGVNSRVAKFLGFGAPFSVGRSAIRGIATYEEDHGFEPKFFQYLGEDTRCGILPSNDHSVYWFCTYIPSPQDTEIEHDQFKMKQFVLSKLGDRADKARAVIESTEAEKFICSPLKCRNPLELLWGSISKGNVCVAGDALHPMTPDLGQGGCAALEDGVVLARCLGEALTKNATGSSEGNDEAMRIKAALEKYAKHRRWRSFELICTGYILGAIQQGHARILNFFRDRVLTKFLGQILLRKADFDCGRLAK